MGGTSLTIKIKIAVSRMRKKNQAQVPLQNAVLSKCILVWLRYPLQNHDFHATEMLLF